MIFTDFFLLRLLQTEIFLTHQPDATLFQMTGDSLELLCGQNKEKQEERNQYVVA